MTHKLPENEYLSSDIQQNATWSALKLDYDRYDELFDSLEISDEEKREYLETIWSVVVAYIDLRLSNHPVQQVCEQDLDLLMQGLLSVLDSKDQALTLEFEKLTMSRKEEI